MTEEIYKLQHQDKSDAELKAIITANAAKATKLPSTSWGIAQTDTLLAEMKACKELLEQRASLKEEGEKEKKEAMQKWPERINRAFLNLPAASGKCGQIVAAVLEEGMPMTKEELHGFCESLTELDEDDFEELLNELEKETIIYRDGEQRYHLENICKEDLLQPDMVESAIQKMKRSVGQMSSKDELIYRMILGILCLDGPAREDEIREFVAEDSKKYRNRLGRFGVKPEDFENIYGTTVDSCLFQLQKNGILSCQTEVAYSFRTLLYFRRLGEEAKG